MVGDMPNGFSVATNGALKRGCEMSRGHNVLEARFAESDVNRKVEHTGIET